MLFGELRAHPARSAIAVIAIAIGVAMGYAVHLINEAATGEFARTVRSLMGNADLEIRGTEAGFSESVYPLVAKQPEVDAASPSVAVEARLSDRVDPLRIIGVDVFRAAAVQPELIGRPAEDTAGALTLLEDDAIFLSPAAMNWLGAKPGDPLRVQVGLETRALRIRGTLAATGEGLRLGVMDIGAAQSCFDRLGMLQKIDLKLRPGSDEEAFRSRLSRLLPAGVFISTPAETAQRSADLSRAYRVNLTVLALVALFTGAFLVFSSQALAVMRRRGQFALLRVLGLRHTQLLRLILAEAALQGALGSGLGLGLGYLVASATLAWAGGDLGAGYFKGVVPEVHFDAAAALVFCLLGLASAVLGSLAPAIEASRAPPARSLRAGDEETALHGLRSVAPGIAAIAAGIALSFLPPIDNLPIAGYLAIALLLTGGIALVPRLARIFFARLPESRHIPLHLASTQLSGASGRAAIGLAGILASFSLMVAMAVMVASFRTSFDQWLGVVLPADLYLRASTSGDTAYFSPADQRNIAKMPDLERVEFQRTIPISLDPDRPPVMLIGRSIDNADPASRIALVGTPRRPRSGEPPPVWVSEAMVDLYGYSLGQKVLLPLGGQWVAVTVAGVWRDYARQHGAVVIDWRNFARLAGDETANEAALWLLPGSDRTSTEKWLRQQLSNGDRVNYFSSGEIRARSLRIFDRSFAVTYLLEAVAIVIGLAGIAVSFGGQTLARTREFGMLRHIGVSRRQIGAMLALEGALLAILGVVAGLILGGAVALILIRVINPQSFHWTMNMSFPWQLISAVALVLVAASAATATWAGRRAMATDAVRAVREDW